uniref:Uncharacterized protein n=1 Tax=Anolis carolinensis TaxID=28377 RepID=A0A803TUR3_ANOCA
MEQEKSYKFKLFLPPKLNNAQVSAVKPQTHTRDGEFYQVIIEYIYIYISLRNSMQDSEYRNAEWIAPVLKIVHVKRT